MVVPELPTEDTLPESNDAPEYEIPDELYFSVEYPGNVVNVDRALASLGGSKAIQRAAEQAEQARLDLRFRPENRYEHAIRASIARTGDLLIKVNRRDGEISHEPIGVVRHTARFRSMADFQWNTSQSPFVNQLESMLSSHVAAEHFSFKIGHDRDPKDYDHDAEPETFDMPPPGIFAQMAVPHRYFYDQVASLHKVTKADGVVMLNKAKPPKQNLYTISYEDPAPLEPHPDLPREPIETDLHLIGVLRSLFDERPTWTRRALFIRCEQMRESMSQSTMKMTLPYVSYMMRSGPWRDTYTRLGYDPRSPLNAHDGAQLQTVFFTSRAVPAPQGPDETTTEGYHFDGVTFRPAGRTFQLCDVTDPQIRKYLDETTLRDTPCAKSGWWPEHRFDVVRAVMKSKLRQLVRGELPVIADYEDYLTGAAIAPGSGARVGRTDGPQNDDDDDEDNNDREKQADEGGTNDRDELDGEDEAVVDPLLGDDVDERVAAIIDSAA